MDLQSITRWEDYSRAKDEMFIHTDIPSAPWYTVESEDKKRSRINVISHLLSTIPYEKIDRPLPEIPHRPDSESDYVRPPRDEFRYVPDVAAHLEEERIKKEEKAKKAKKPAKAAGKNSDKKKSSGGKGKKKSKK